LFYFDIWDMQRTFLSRTLIACTLLACTRTLYHRAYPVSTSGFNILSAVRHQSTIAQSNTTSIATATTIASTTTMAKTETLPAGEQMADELPKIAPADFRAYNRMAE